MHEADRAPVLGRLLEQRQGVGGLSGEQAHGAERRGDPGDIDAELAARLGQDRLEEDGGPLEVPLDERDSSGTEARPDALVRGLGRVSNGDRLPDPRVCLGEVALFGERHRHPHAAADRLERRPAAKAFVGQRPWQRREGAARGLDRARIVSERIVGAAHHGVGAHLRVKIAGLLGQRPAAVGDVDGASVVAEGSHGVAGGAEAHGEPSAITERLGDRYHLLEGLHLSREVAQRDQSAPELAHDVIGLLHPLATLREVS